MSRRRRGEGGEVGDEGEARAVRETIYRFLSSFVAVMRTRSTTRRPALMAHMRSMHSEYDLKKR